MQGDIRPGSVTSVAGSRRRHYLVVSWISSIGQRLRPHRQVDHPAVLDGVPGVRAGRSGPGPEVGYAPPLSDALRSAYAERKRVALAIVDQSAAELSTGSTDQVAAAIGQVAGIAHQLAGTAGYFNEAELGRVAAAVDYQLREESTDDRRAVAGTIAEFRAALLESSAQPKRSAYPRSRAQRG